MEEPKRQNNLFDLLSHVLLYITRHEQQKLQYVLYERWDSLSSGSLSSFSCINYIVSPDEMANLLIRHCPTAKCLPEEDIHMFFSSFFFLMYMLCFSKLILSDRWIYLQEEKRKHRQTKADISY